MNTSISIGSTKFTFRVEILILIAFVLWVLFAHVLCSCANPKINIRDGFFSDVKKDVIEGFGGGGGVGFGGDNIPYISQYENYKHPTVLDTNKWPMPTLTFTKGVKPDKAIEDIWHRKKQPIPLPEGELNMFATTPFKPECCPNTYSNSMGCACMTVDQYTYLRKRGGNNVPYSEY
jgi:hypothetical protein